MKNVNSVSFGGRLTRDAELKHLNSGTAICQFSIAVNTSKKQGDEYVDEANFFDCKIWGKYGEAMAQYLTKGRQVFVHGSAKQERWEKDGQSHSAIRFEIDSMELGSEPRGQQESEAPRQASKPQPRVTQTLQQENPDGFPDDIPFN